MKNACRLIACIVFLLVAGSVYADEICYVSRVTLSGLPRSMVGQILNAFQMNTGIGAPPDVSCYEIQFVFATQLVIGNETRNQVSAIRPFDGSFTYQPDSSDSRPIYISGLNLKQGDDLVLPTDPALGREKSFLNIIGTAGRRVILKDSILANVRQGIFADGDGPTDIENVTITGDAAKSGPCLSVNAAGATITGGEFSNCSNGIRVGANNVTIAGATIHDNKYGVYVDAGISGMKVERMRIFGNVSGVLGMDPRKEGIFFADQTRDIKFYDIVGNNVVDVSDLTETVHNYESRTPYITLPETPVAGSKIEFYESSSESSPCRQQTCAPLGANEIHDINSTEFTQNKSTSIQLSQSAVGKSVVAVYTHPDLGSTVISRTFSIAQPGPVTFVAGPFEIPTSGVAQGGGDTGGNTGGGTDDDADDDKTNSSDTGNSMSDGANPIDVTSLPESGGAQTFTGGGGAAVGAKCSLTTTGATLHTMALGMDLWWLILAAIVVGSLRTVKVRIRKK